MSNLNIGGRDVFPIHLAFVQVTVSDIPYPPLGVLQFQLERGSVSSEDVGQPVHWSFFGGEKAGDGVVRRVVSYPSGITLMVDLVQPQGEGVQQYEQ